MWLFDPPPGSRPLVNTLLVFDKTNKSRYLRNFLKEEVNQSAVEIEFNADNSEIKNIIASGVANVSRLLDFPVLIIPNSYQKINVTILPSTTSDSNENDSVKG